MELGNLKDEPHSLHVINVRATETIPNQTRSSARCLIDYITAVN